jgi:C4-dicarboxylate transporter, DctM subunit
MSPELIGYIGLVVMMVLLFMRIWVGLVLALVGFVGIWIIQGLNPAIMIAGQMPYQMLNTYEYSVMPMFILMGMLIADTGIGGDLYVTARAMLGQFRGGLVQATIFACACIAAITGTSTTGIMVMTKVALPEMKKLGYDEALAAGSIASASTMGILIPPSIGFILYGIITQISIGKLFIAGVLPGITQGIFYMITTYIICRINPRIGPAGPRTTVKEKFKSLKFSWSVLLLFVIVIGGIYGGIFTPTEAGATGSFGACVIAIASRRFNGRTFLQSCLETALMTTMIVLVLAGTVIFQNFLTVTKVPAQMAAMISSFNVSVVAVIVAIVILYIILGCFLPIIPIILITVPIMFPIITALNLDPIWFGVIMVREMEIGNISPPFGMNVFIQSGVSGIPVGTVFKGVIPFLIADFFHVAMLAAFPAISLFLPNLMS